MSGRMILLLVVVVVLGGIALLSLCRAAKRARPKPRPEDIKPVIGLLPPLCDCCPQPATKVLSSATCEWAASWYYGHFCAACHDGVFESLRLECLRANQLKRQIPDLTSGTGSGRPLMP